LHGRACHGKVMVETNTGSPQYIILHNTSAHAAA
jgi:hypothetical protein